MARATFAHPTSLPDRVGARARTNARARSLARLALSDGQRRLPRRRRRADCVGVMVVVGQPETARSALNPLVGAARHCTSSLAAFFPYDRDHALRLTVPGVVEFSPTRLKLARADSFSFSITVGGSPLHHRRLVLINPPLFTFARYSSSVVGVAPLVALCGFLGRQRPKIARKSPFPR